jgi:hypothetical protein
VTVTVIERALLQRAKGEGGMHLSPFCRIVDVKTHDAIDRRSLTMVRRIVEKIDSDPSRAGLEHARKVCARWVERGNRPAVEWMAILQGSWPEIRSILLDESEEGKRLRQSDPFCGILTPLERWEIYREAARNETR